MLRERSIFLALGAVWVLVGAGVLLWQRNGPSLIFRWETKTEVDAAGFNLYRAPAGDNGCGAVAAEAYVQLNTALIPSEGTATTGSVYEFIDDSVVSGQQYCYLLEDVEFDQSITRHEPYLATASPSVLWVAMLVAAGAGIIVGVGLTIYGLRLERL